VIYRSSPGPFEEFECGDVSEDYDNALRGGAAFIDFQKSGRY
jgi:hypothetical protein